MILAHQRIGRRHRRRRQARLHRGLRHQRVLDRIAGEDGDGAAVSDAEIEQALRQRVDGALGFAVGDFSPLPVRAAALRQPDAIGRSASPISKAMPECASRKGCSGMRDFSTMTPSGRRSTSMSRFSHSILRKPGFVSTAAAFPLILRLPEFSPLRILFLALDIDRLSFFKKGPDALAEFFRAAAQDLVAVFHRDHGLDRAGIDAHIEAFLGEPQAHRRGRHHRIDIRFGRRIEPAFLDHFGDEADGERTLGADEAAGQDQFGGHGDADQARQEIAGADVAAAEARA